MRILDAQNRLRTVFNLTTYDLAVPANRATLKGLFLDAARPVDSDGDGLADDWETIYFGGLGPTAIQDGDSDGASNLAEFALGTNPTNSFSSPKLRMNYTLIGSQLRPTLVYRRQSGGAFRYLLESSDYPTIWTSGTGFASPTVTRHFDGTGTATITVPLTWPLAWPDRRFFRVRASSP